MKKENKLLLILGAIFTGIVVLVTAICILLPRITSVSNVHVPDVSNMDEVEAEKILIKEGLKINPELVPTPSDTIEEGKVVKTDPAAGRTVKENTEVTIYTSSGANALVVEDYTGKNYIEIKAKIEATYSINVKTEKKTVDNPADYKASEIIDQYPAPGEKVMEGGTLTLYYPDIEEVYPDFTTGDYSLSEIEEFAEKYNLKFNVNYVATNEAPAGSIINQSRAANTPIAPGASFTITIAEEVYTGEDEVIE